MVTLHRLTNCDLNRLRRIQVIRMQKLEYKDCTLVLIGHGSTLNADSASPTYLHADALRRRGLFGQVLEGFWKQEPYLAGVLRGAWFPTVFIVPLFISEGYFTEQVIPRELGFAANGDGTYQRVRQEGGRTYYYCGPIGTHPSMTASLLARAEEAVRSMPESEKPAPQETTLFIAGHGTGNNENSRKVIERQVELIRERKVYAEVHPVFMEEEPRVGDCYTMAATPNIIMVPFFISDGLHSYEDIPVMLGESPDSVRERMQTGEPTWVNPTERNGKRLWYTPSIGSEPHIVEVILERVSEAAKRD